MGTDGGLLIEEGSFNHLRSRPIQSIEDAKSLQTHRWGWAVCCEFLKELDGSWVASWDVPPCLLRGLLVPWSLGPLVAAPADQLLMDSIPLGAVRGVQGLGQLDRGEFCQIPDWAQDFVL